MEDLHQRLRASEEKLIDLDILKMSAEKERDLLQKDVASLQGQISTLSKESETLRVSKEDAEKACHRFKEKSHLLEIQVAELSSEMDKLRDQLEHSERLVHDLKQSGEELNQRLAKLDQEKLGLSQELDLTRGQRTDLQARVEKLAAENTGYVTEIGCLKENLESLALSEKTCHKSFDEKFTYMETFYKEKLHDCQQRIEFLSSERSMLEKKVEEFVLMGLSYEELKVQNSTMENEFYALQKENADIREHLKR